MKKKSNNDVTAGKENPGGENGGGFKKGTRKRNVGGGIFSFNSPCSWAPANKN
jgi:hypothetical protein